MLYVVIILSISVANLFAIRQTDTPLPAFKTATSTRVALALCTLGIALFGICSCIYDYLFAASAL